MKSADFNDFTGCFDNITAKVSVRKFMENWLNEPGFPMVKITKVGLKTSTRQRTLFTVIYGKLGKYTAHHTKSKVWLQQYLIELRISIIE